MSQYSPKATAGRLRDLRRSYGYETAASFARAIGYPVARYQRYERDFSVGDVAELYHAMRRVGPVSLGWLISWDPKWDGPLLARAALRVRNGVSAKKAIDAYHQEFTAAMEKHRERLAQEG